MSKSALVTGAHGFIGRHVSRELAAQGYTVSGIGHGSWGRTEQLLYGLTFWHSADVTLDTLVTYGEEPDVIMHCAGSGSVAFSMAHPYQDYMRTVTATTAVLEYIRLYSPKSLLVYPSSAAVYGKTKDLPISERSAQQPISPYGVHKQMAENLCGSYARNFGLSIAILRFFSVYGEGLQKQLLWDASRKITHGETEFFGTGEETRDWLHVEDAAKLFLAAIPHASQSCPISNGAAGKGIPVRRVLEALFRHFGLNQQPDFTKAVRGGDPEHYVADIRNAQGWGWQPTISLEAGLKRYAEWFKDMNCG